MRIRIRATLVVMALGSLALAAPSSAKEKKEAAFKLLSASGTQTHTFFEDGLYDGGSPQRRCTGSQSINVRYHTTKATKMYVFVREAHGLHTLISGTPEPAGGLDYLTVPGEMTLSRSFDYQATEGCFPPPPACPETTVSSNVIVSGNHEPSGGISSIYDTDFNPPPGFDENCRPQPWVGFGPLSAGADPPEVDEDDVTVAGAIPRAQIFGKKKRLSGEDSMEFSYEVRREPPLRNPTTVVGTYGETIAIELKRLKPKKD